ncbi:ankyrin repeat-containing protein [Talaromyces pinophilus]|jgi:ankyrin repeat protein|uniref:Ankyrin repeat-containing protein n=1 Tax=Talaromyces pinophilus TaxID=128442 RepID=A0A6V8HBJ8_TALPI|nr:ankyrin repeat-containing protein [Talaromyces pinophilus]
MSLLSLPIELVHLIASLLDREADINSLAQTNNLNYTRLNGFLYQRNVQVSESSALIWAANHGRKNTADLSLRHGANRDTTCSRLGLTPLCWAAHNGDVPMAVLLLQNGGANINARCSDSRRWTPLSFAAAQGNEDMVRLLLADERVDVETKDSRGLSPAFLAASKGHLAVVKLLLETGRVNANSEGPHGQTLFSWAARWGHAAVVATLLATGSVVVNSRDPQFGRTALAWASLHGHETVVRLLVGTKGIDLNVGDFTDRTPLHLAAWKGHAAVVALLLKSRVDVQPKDDGGLTPLSMALRWGHGLVVELLLQETGEADVNTRGEDSSTLYKGIM